MDLFLRCAPFSMNSVNGMTNRQNLMMNEKRKKNQLLMNLVKFSKEFLFSFFQMVLGSLFSIPNIFVHRRNENIAFKI